MMLGHSSRIWLKIRIDANLRKSEIGPMLEMKPGCERCGVNLPQESMEAVICSYECTFCADCSH